MLNLTQHLATPEQIAAGVVDLNEQKRAVLVSLLTFDDLPTPEDLENHARAIAYLAKGEGALEAMIGGAPFFMSTLERELKDAGIKAFYAFSKRESIERHIPDGSVQKTNVFKHVGFVEAHTRGLMSPEDMAALTNLAIAASRL